MPYSWHNPRKFSVPSALSANSLLWSIGSLFFHGIYRLFYSGSAFSSVTYLLNLWCYLCPEPAPRLERSYLAQIPKFGIVLVLGALAPDTRDRAPCQPAFRLSRQSANPLHSNREGTRIDTNSPATSH